MMILLYLFFLPIVNSLFTTAGPGNAILTTTFGTLEKEVSFTTKIYVPGIQYVYYVKFTEDIDTKNDAVCSDNRGNLITYNQIKVGNKIMPQNIYQTVYDYGFKYDERLVTDLVLPFLQLICSNYTYTELELTKRLDVSDKLKELLQHEQNLRETGIIITQIIMSGAKIPTDLKEKRDLLNIEIQAQRLATEKFKTIELDKKNLALAQEADDARILNSTLAAIALHKANAIWENERKIAEATTYANEMTIISNAKAITNLVEESHIRNMFAIPGFKEVEQAKALFNSTKIYFGNHIPDNMWLENSNLN
jgi:regulator of protease activity HflC (stomatin/prohibitin superfamily)